MCMVCLDIWISQAPCQRWRPIYGQIQRFRARQTAWRGIQVTAGLPLQQYNADGEAAMLNRSRFHVQALSTVATIAVLAIPAVPAAQGSGAPVSSFYDLKTSYLDGKPADLGAFRGKVTLAVNVASKCGFTPQYEGLEKLNRELAPKGFAVLGFPSNDFGAQEPGTAQEIAQFCKLTYDVTFPMFSKLVTKPGKDQSPVYAFLGTSGHLPAWNFSKYVIGKDGRIVAFFPSEVTPESPELRRAITKALESR
jgi:glutathione peroxidase